MCQLAQRSGRSAFYVRVLLIRIGYPGRRSIDMTEQFTIGIEEEFQTVDRYTGQLSPYITTILQKGTPFGDQIKPEMLQPTVELISKVYPNIAVARSETQRLRARLASMLAEDGLALISAGTNPGAHCTDQLVTPGRRYSELLGRFPALGL